MENLTHSRQPNMLSKKSYNGNTNKSIYDDVFGGPPKFGATTLSPRVEDYSEIFGGFHSSRASSIPVLDLPLVVVDDDDESADVFFDVRSSSGFDYSEVFGGFNGHDFGVSYEELMMMEQSNVPADSSDDEAWTPAEADNLSEEESDHSAKDQCLSNGDSHESFDDGVEFNISYNKSSRRMDEDLSNGVTVTHITQHHDVSGYTFAVDKGACLLNSDIEYQLMHESNDDSLHINYSGEMLRGKQLKKVMSHPANGSTDGLLFGSEMRPRRDFVRNISVPSGMFVTVSDVSLRTVPSDLPPPSRPPPALDDKSGDSGKATPTCKGASPEETTGDCSPPYFDVEVDASSSAAVSAAAAMKEAMEKAQAKLRSAKESMEKKREGFQTQSKSGSKKDKKDKDETKLGSGSGSRKDERGQANNQRVENGIEFSVSQEKQKIIKSSESNLDPIEGKKHVNVAKVHEEEDYGREFFSSQGSDRIDETGEWKEATQFFELVTNDSRKLFVQENSSKVLVPDSNFHERGKKEKKKSGEALQQLHENDRKIKAVRADHHMEEYEKKSQVSKEAFEWDKISGRSEEANKQKVSKKVQVARAGNENKIETFGQPIETGKKHAKPDVSLICENSLEVQQKESSFAVRQNMKHKDKESWSKEDEKNKRDLKNFACEKEGSERKQKKAVALEENEKKLTMSLEQTENERMLKNASEQEVKEKMMKAVHKLEKNEKLQREVYEREENEKRFKEVLVREENERRLKEALEKEENERRLKETREKEDRLSRQKVAAEKEQNERREKEARESVQNEKRQREACEREEKRLKEALEKEEKGRRLKENLEKEETQRRLREAVEREETAKREREANEMRQKEALEKEEMQRKIREAAEQEENVKREREQNEKRLKEAAEREENEKRQREAHEREEAEKKHREAYEKEENKMSFKETSEKEEIEERITEVLENKVGERPGETHEQQENCRTSTEAQEEKGSGTVLKEGNNPEVIKEVPQAAEWEEMLKIHGKAGESGKQRVLSKMGEGRSELNPASRLDGDKNHQTNQLHGKHERNGEKLEATEEIACDEISKKFTELRNGEEAAAPGMVQDNLERESIRIPTEIVTDNNQKTNEKVNGRFQVDLDFEIEGKKFAYDRSELLNQGNNKDYSMSARVEREPVEGGRKVERSQSAISEVKGSTSRTAQQVNAISITERKVKNSYEAPLSEDKEGERLKRERELERERLRKIEEEREREREREKDRMAVDRTTLEIRADARDRAERSAVERAAAEARQRALNDARERLERACAEAREKSLPDKASEEARLRAERAAVERATVEARERAFEKAMAERAVFEARERVERSVSDKFYASSRNGVMRASSSSSDLQSQGTSSINGSRYQYSSVCSERYEGLEGESAQRCKARLERHRRTAERAAKALAEKNMRDLLAQREQTERNRLAETLDADVKRWSSGKEGNLRALISTLQYILGPDSGWQPIPLTEVITAAAVKKAYRKASLCVHPDKLQQRGASIQQKYICEKVFDLLKEAWNKFNSEER